MRKTVHYLHVHARKAKEVQKRVPVIVKLVIIAVASVLVVSGTNQPADAAFGRDNYQGYATGRQLALYGQQVLSGGCNSSTNLCGTGALPASNTAQFISQIECRLNRTCGDGTRDQIGAAFIINTMLGHPGTDFGTTAASINNAFDRFQTWRNRVTRYDTEGRTHYEVPVNYASGHLNSYYDPGVRDNGFYNDRDAQTQYTIVFDNPDGSHFYIKQNCGNVVLDSAPLQGPTRPEITTRVVGGPEFQPNTIVEDRVTIDSLDNAGTIHWELRGPVAPNANGTCTGLNWSGQPTFTIGTLDVPGSGTYTITPTQAPTAQGCYSFQITLIAPPEETVIHGFSEPNEQFEIVSSPRVRTVISDYEFVVNPGSIVRDTAFVTGNAGLQGTLDWTIYGPVAPLDGSCLVDFTGAPVFETGSVDVDGNETVTITPTQEVQEVGCYSYGMDLNEPNLVYSHPPGVAGEVFAVRATPTVQTVISEDGYSDSIEITDTEGYHGTNLWILYGPVAPSSDGTCDTVDWEPYTQPNDYTYIYAYEFIEITGDGTYTATPPTQPTGPGCYSYANWLFSDLYTEINIIPAGDPLESFALPATPKIVTTINKDGYSDDVVVTDTNGFSGTMTWILYGPIPLNGDSCVGLDWTNAPIYEQGIVEVNGDGTYTVTPAKRPDGTGCYSYYEILEGPNYTVPTESPVGQIPETFLVPELAKTGQGTKIVIAISSVLLVVAVAVKRSTRTVHYRYTG